MRRIRRGLLLLVCAAWLTSCSDEHVAGPSAAGSNSGSAMGTDAPACVLKPPAEPRTCTQQYDPVCGCDGQTYGNACMAAGAGVPWHTPGACVSGADQAPHPQS